MLIARDVAAAGSAALIFAITPVFAVWGLETSAEPFSNGCITLISRKIKKPLSSRIGHHGRTLLLLLGYVQVGVTRDGYGPLYR